MDRAHRAHRTRGNHANHEMAVDLQATQKVAEVATPTAVVDLQATQEVAEVVAAAAVAVVADPQAALQAAVAAVEAVEDPQVDPQAAVEGAADKVQSQTPCISASPRRSCCLCGPQLLLTGSGNAQQSSQLMLPQDVKMTPAAAGFRSFGTCSRHGVASGCRRVCIVGSQILPSSFSHGARRLYNVARVW